MQDSIIINWIDYRFGNLLATENQQAIIDDVIEVKSDVYLYVMKNIYENREEYNIT